MTRHATIKLRPAAPADAREIHAMLLALAAAIGKTGDITSTADDLEAALAGEAPDISAIIAESGGRPVGVAIFFLTFSTWMGSRGVYLQDLFVAPEAQGAGVGRRLVDAVVAWGIDRRASHLRLSVDRSNTGARDFYESVGMARCAGECIYMLPGISPRDETASS